MNPPSQKNNSQILEGKIFAVGRLSYVLQLAPDYAEYFYRTVMDYTEGFPIAEKIVPGTLSEYEKLYQFIKKNNLWQLRKQIQGKIDFCSEEMNRRNLNGKC